MEVGHTAHRVGCVCVWPYSGLLQYKWSLDPVNSVPQSPCAVFTTHPKSFLPCAEQLLYYTKEIEVKTSPFQLFEKEEKLLAFLH